MAIPQGVNAFQWMRQQIYELSRTADNIQRLFADWSLFNAAQKSAFRQRAVDAINAAITELQAVRDNIAGL